MSNSEPTYKLEDIQAQMNSPNGLHCTLSAKNGVRELGMDMNQVVTVVQNLSSSNFYKSMPCDNPSLNPQDVYHAEFSGVEIYIKFQEENDRFIFKLISFKEK